jgi:hypothetical protein
MSWLWSARFIIVKIGSPFAARAWSTRTLGSTAVGLPAWSVVGHAWISWRRPGGTGKSTSRSVAARRSSHAATAASAMRPSSQSM